MAVNTTKTTQYVNTLDGKFENKQANKKNDISGDFLGDTASYPTAHAVQDYAEAKSNKVTTLSSSSTHQMYPSAKLVYDQLLLKEDLSNKVTTLSSNSTNQMYPSAKLMYDQLLLKEDKTNKVTSWSQTPSDINYPSEKLVKDNLDLKVNITDIKDNLTSTDTNKPLSANQGKELKTLIDAKGINITQLGANDVTQGMAATYQISQGSTVVGLIDIPKDKFLRSASVETVGATPTAEETAHNMTTGDEYILLVVNTIDNQGSTNLIIPMNTFLNVYSGDNTSITINNGVISITVGYIESIIDAYLDDIISRL